MKRYEKIGKKGIMKERLKGRKKWVLTKWKW